MFNTVIISGRLTANPELKTTNGGKSVCNFTIAVERKFKQGADKPTDFIDIVAWGNTAEFVSKYFSLGQMIGIEGSIQTRKYTDKNGNNRTAFEILANNVQFMGYKESKGNGDNSTSQNQNSSYSLNNDATEFAEFSGDDDLPF
jgi:single-strand DNA-binding protein